MSSHGPFCAIVNTWFTEFGRVIGCGFDGSVNSGETYLPFAST
jgi:hypothetical protein